jgi:hypothetical protein
MRVGVGQGGSRPQRWLLASRITAGVCTNCCRILCPRLVGRHPSNKGVPRRHSHASWHGGVETTVSCGATQTADRKNKRPFCASTPGACPLKPPSATGWRPRPRRCPCAPEPGGAPHRAPLLRVDIRRRTGARRAQRCPTQGAGLGTGGLERGLRWDLKHPAAACPQETSSARMAPTSPHATLGA